MRLTKLRLVAIAAAVGAGTLVQLPQAKASGGRYYVDCTAGNDANSGTTPALAWQSVTRANKAPLGPGQQLWLRRGCTWDRQQLDAAWVGTAIAPVLIGAYGTGADPVIKNGPKLADVKVTGAWQTLDHISVSVDPTQFASCGTPLGVHYGFNVVAPAHDNTIQNSTATKEQVGIHLAKGSSNSHILSNMLSGNNMVDAFHKDPTVDLGAWGILVNSDNNDIGYNQLQDNVATCRNQGYKLQSNSIELYAARGNSIHHNVALRDRVFSELGGSSAVKSSGNTFAYNIFATALAESRFLVTRGALDTKYGPVLFTTLIHNSTYETGPLSLGISCGLGCGSSVLNTDSNIFWVDGMILWADAAFPNHNDIYWATNGSPRVQAPFTPSALIVNPLYVDPAHGNLRLRPGSLAGSAQRPAGGYPTA